MKPNFTIVKYLYAHFGRCNKNRFAKKSKVDESVFPEKLIAGFFFLLLFLGQLLAQSRITPLKFFVPQPETATTFKRSGDAQSLNLNAGNNLGRIMIPIASNSTMPSQVNPGGTTNVLVLSNYFTASNAGGPSANRIRISVFPTNVNSISINGVVYNSAAALGAGITIPVDVSGHPTQPIYIDPTDGAVASAIIYSAVDVSGTVSSPATVNVPFTATISVPACAGMDPLDGLTVLAGNTAGQVYTTFPNNPGSPHTVLSIGTYLLKQNVFFQNGVPYDIVMKINSIYNPTPGYAGWPVNANLLLNSAGSLSLVGSPKGDPYYTFNVTIVEHGSATTANPAGIPVSLSNVFYAITDIDGGGVGSEFTDIAGANIAPVNIGSNLLAGAFDPGSYSSTYQMGGVVNYSALPADNMYQNFSLYRGSGFVPCTSGVINTVVTDMTYALTYAFDLYPLQGVDILFGSTGCYEGISNRGNSQYILFCHTFKLSGSLFNDTDALTDNAVDELRINNPSGASMFVNLVDPLSNTVLATTAIQSDGTYEFNDVKTGNYHLVLTANSPGSSTASVPAGWINTGENIGASAGYDGSVNGVLPVTISTSTGNIVNANFGIQQPPTAIDGTLPFQLNPGGTISVPIPTTYFDGNDQNGGIVTSLTITSFPANATSITINGIMYTSATFPVGGVTIPVDGNGTAAQTIALDPVNGSVTCTIPYVSTDNGNAVSVPAVVTASFWIILPVKLITFNAASRDCSVFLSWKLNESLLYNKFEIERSDDNGTQFTSVYESCADALGTNSEFVDKPGLMPGQKYLYRLKMTLSNGVAAYSNIIALDYKCNERNMLIYPNPAKNVVNAFLNGYKSSVFYRLYNENGQVVGDGVLRDGTNQFEIRHLQAGTYFMVLYDKNQEVERAKLAVISQ